MKKLLLLIATLLLFTSCASVEVPVKKEYGTYAYIRDGYDIYVMPRKRTLTYEGGQWKVVVVTL